MFRSAFKIASAAVLGPMVATPSFPSNPAWADESNSIKPCHTTWGKRHGGEGTLDTFHGTTIGHARDTGGESVLSQLDTLTLRVGDPDAQRRFYRDTLGMVDRGDDRLGYAETEVALRFVPAETPYAPSPSDLYWKIALSVPNIDLAVDQLRARGVEATAPRQFRDVGYLAKFTDPEGFTVELLDHWFQGERPNADNDASLLGGGPHLSLVTLRTAGIGAVEPALMDAGMTPLSVQPVEPFGFTLYFYAFTDERPPQSDLTAIENRAWTYRRPYTVLELQHVDELDMETSSSRDAAGYEALTIRGARKSLAVPRLRIASA